MISYRLCPRITIMITISRIQDQHDLRYQTGCLHWQLQDTREKKANPSDSFRQVVRKASFIWSAWHPKSQWKYSFYWSGETRQKHKLVWIGRPLIIVTQTFCTGIRNMCHGEYQKYLQNIRKLSPTSFILRYAHLDILTVFLWHFPSNWFVD